MDTYQIAKAISEAYRRHLMLNLPIMQILPEEIETLQKAIDAQTEAHHAYEKAKYETRHAANVSLDALRHR